MTSIKLQLTYHLSTPGILRKIIVCFNCLKIIISKFSPFKTVLGLIFHNLTLIQEILHKFLQAHTSTFHQFFKQHTIYTKFDFHPSVFSDLDLILLIVLATYCGGLWCLWLEVEVDGLGVLRGLGAGRGVPLIDQIQEWAAVFFDRLKQQFYRSSI